MLQINEQFQSPNFDERPEEIAIDTIVIHYTDTLTSREALDILCDKEKKVSAHFLITEEGVCHSLVPVEKRAWHAGISYWRGRDKVNDFSIGIELVNPGHRYGYRPFTEAQMHRLMVLLKQLATQYPIKPYNIVGHSDIAPTRKFDPGELFDWYRLALNGFGFYPRLDISDENKLLLKIGDTGPEVKRLQSRLNQFGYLTYQTGNFDEYTVAVVKAFKRHYYPDVIDSVWDVKAEVTLDRLLYLARELMIA